MEINNFIKSKTFLRIILAVFALALLVGVFQAGELVGYRKARFSYAWGEQYDKNFGGPRRAIFGMPMGDPRFESAHGVFGSVIKNDSNTLVIQGQNGVEKVVRMDAQTMIQSNRDTLTVGDLKTGTQIVVIGNPNDQGEIVARLIRILISPTSSPTPNVK